VLTLNPVDVLVQEYVAQDLCAIIGSDENFRNMFTAAEACCACGGGLTHDSVFDRWLDGNVSVPGGVCHDLHRFGASASLQQTIAPDNYVCMCPLRFGGSTCDQILTTPTTTGTTTETTTPTTTTQATTTQTTTPTPTTALHKSNFSCLVSNYVSYISVPGGCSATVGPLNQLMQACADNAEPGSAFADFNQLANHENFFACNTTLVYGQSLLNARSLGRCLTGVNELAEVFSYYGLETTPTFLSLACEAGG